MTNEYSTPEEIEAALYMDTHKLGTCLRFANGQTCVGCGDEENGHDIESSATVLPELRGNEKAHG